MFIVGLKDATINKLAHVANDWLLGGAKAVRSAAKQEFVHPVTGATEKMFTKTEALKEGFKARGDELSIGGYSAKKLAGSYIAASGAARIATGGGVYRDSSGNADIIGIPFI